jgi:metal-dependent amidase/aminoacylase/carboxypeptidase family protein
MSAADSIRITVYGRGGHGSMPQHAVDPVVLAAMIVVRLQTVVSREVAPGDTAVVTVGSLQAGTRSNVIPDYAVLELNMRSYSAVTRQRMLDAIGRIVRAECQASGSPKDPEFETTGNGALSVVIDAPPMNLIGPELVRDLVSLLGALESGEETRVMVLESADPEYFVPHVDQIRGRPTRCDPLSACSTS